MKPNSIPSAGTEAQTPTAADVTTSSQPCGNTLVVCQGSNEPNTALSDFVKSSPTVQAAITEAVHRFYYDRINSGKKQDQKDLQETNASDIFSTLLNLQPNWRFILEKTAKRYNSEDVIAVTIFGKPKNIIGLKLEIELR